MCEKPVGILSAPEPGRRRDMPTLLKKQTRTYKIDVIHRLDQPVGGAMVYAKSSRATPGLYRQMAEHRFVKEYLAVVRGIPHEQSGEWRDHLLKDAARAKSRVVPEGTRGAKEAVLTYTVLSTVRPDGGAPLTLVRVRLHTGRTHQIRVHMKYIGHPLIGDFLYHPDFRQIDRQALHAARLSFLHPIKKEPLVFTAPLPPDMQALFPGVKFPAD